jgi:hypothetical protein
MPFSSLFKKLCKIDVVDFETSNKMTILFFSFFAKAPGDLMSFFLGCCFVHLHLAFQNMLGYEDKVHIYP